MINVRNHAKKVYKTKFKIGDLVVVETKTKGGAPHFIYDKISAIRITHYANHVLGVKPTYDMTFGITGDTLVYGEVLYVEYYISWIGKWVKEFEVMPLKKFMQKHKGDFKKWLKEYNQKLIDDFYKENKNE